MCNVSYVIIKYNYTGLALHEIKHPAITICSQGLNQDKLNEAIKRQFERFVLEVKGKNLTGQNYRIKRSPIDAKALWKEYVQAYYPGSKITPNSLVQVLIATNPDKVLRAKTLTNKNSICTNAIDCSTPIQSPNADCFDRQYFWNGGIGYGHADNVDSPETCQKKCQAEALLGAATTCGWWTYDVDNHRNNPKRCYFHSIKPTLKMLMSDQCVWGTPICVISGPTTCTSRRRKRSVTDKDVNDEGKDSVKYSLDRVFVQEEKIKHNLLVKQIKANYTSNFMKMDLYKSYPNLFELLW